MRKRNGKRLRFRRSPRLQALTNSNNSRKVNFGWTSSNWSGYALKRTQGAFRSISGEWIVPAVSPANQSTYSSIWIGIDGFNNTSLIQTGTEQEYVNGKAVYYAWWEILPSTESIIPHPVSPGDAMRAVITKLRTGRWSIRITNKTKKWTFQTVKEYSGPQKSAEWVVEAPQINGVTNVLAHYGRTVFYNCKVNGRNPKLTSSDGGVMVQKQIAVSTPSLPNTDRNGFTVAYGAKSPKPPNL